MKRFMTVEQVGKLSARSETYRAVLATLMKGCLAAFQTDISEMLQSCDLMAALEVLIRPDTSALGARQANGRVGKHHQYFWQEGAEAVEFKQDLFGPTELGHRADQRLRTNSHRIFVVICGETFG